MDRFWVLCAGLTLLTYSLAHLYRLTALALHIVDQPNHRSAHSHVTPTGAGLTFVATFCLSVLVIQLTGGSSDVNVLLLACLPALLLVWLLGFVDDFRPLPWWLRALVHFGAATWIIAIVGFPEQVLPFDAVIPREAWLVFGVFSLVWLQNLYNFMDGIDGIAIGEALFALAAALGIAAWHGVSPEKPLVALMACCLGFALINWPKARVFMGDGGSGFLGLMLGIVALSETLVPLWTWLILLAWFITDASLTIVTRLARRERITEAHSQHAYQHLNRALGTQKTLWLLLAVNGLWLLPMAAAAASHPRLGLMLFLLAALPLLIFQWWLGAGQVSPRFRKGAP